MATDDSIVQLDTLRDILNGKKIITAGSLRSERSSGSAMGRASLANTQNTVAFSSSLKD